MAALRIQTLPGYPNAVLSQQVEIRGQQLFRERIDRGVFGRIGALAHRSSGGAGIETVHTYCTTGLEFVGENLGEPFIGKF